MKNVFFALLIVCPSLGQACSLAQGYKAFSPTMESFEALWDGNRSASLPAPDVGAIKLRRGTDRLGAPCPIPASLTLDMAWPASSPYKLGEIGFYFRVISGKQPNDGIFPLSPITGKVGAHRAQFSFYWLDDIPSRRHPLNLDVEVFAINHGLQIGAARRFRVTEAGGSGQR